mmetsp:Transcript_6544/g.18870  ORF Transcript_6544/g.18870 Transcript_6544/m.18870 type:complete len:312 (+) Transcript_6544:937-1872(+)
MAASPGVAVAPAASAPGLFHQQSCPSLRCQARSGQSLQGWWAMVWCLCQRWQAAFARSRGALVQGPIRPSQFRQRATLQQCRSAARDATAAAATPGGRCPLPPAPPTPQQPSSRSRSHFCHRQHRLRLQSRHWFQLDLLRRPKHGRLQRRQHSFESHSHCFHQSSLQCPRDPPKPPRHVQPPPRQHCSRKYRLCRRQMCRSPHCRKYCQCRPGLQKPPRRERQLRRRRFCQTSKRLPTVLCCTLGRLRLGRMQRSQSYLQPPLMASRQGNGAACEPTAPGEPSLLQQRLLLLMQVALKMDRQERKKTNGGK